MKICEEYAALLDAFVDGELPEAESARVREHLTCCADCRFYAEASLAIRGAFPKIEDTPVPDGFAEGVCAAIRLSSRKKRKAPWVKAMLPLAACLAVVVALQAIPMGGQDHVALGGSIADRAMPPTLATERAAPAPEAQLDEGAPQTYLANAAPAESPAANTPKVALPTPALTLTLEEAGTLLDGFAGADYQSGDLSGIAYELTAEEYAALLSALPPEIAARSARPDSVSILVLVTP